MRKQICLFLVIIMAFILMPFNALNASADTLIDFVQVRIKKFPHITLDMTGSEASEMLYETFMEADSTEGTEVDPNDCYLAYRDGDSFVSLKFSDEPLVDGRYYYYVINVITQSGYTFNQELPYVSLNGSKANEVKWYSSLKRSVDTYFWTYVDGQDFPEITPTIKNIPGTGVKLTWDAVPGTVIYKVYKSDLQENVSAYVGETTGYTITDKKVNGGYQYKYYVYAYDEYGQQIAWTQDPQVTTYNPFTDVKEKASYFSHLMWTVRNGVIKGKTSTTFAPNESCKRCDLAVMLYRMYGKPSVSGKTVPFTDVKKSAYYYDAVVWAYNMGYIKGTSKTKFNPNGTISRQDMVVILWRINGKYTVSVTNPFTDVDEDSYAYKAIMWAYYNNITRGTSSTTFAPYDDCLRYQLAVFLHKFNSIQGIIPE